MSFDVKIQPAGSQCRGTTRALLAIALLLGPLAIGLRSQSILRMSVDPQGQPANSSSNDTAISGDGQWVAFASRASNLVPNDSNDSVDVFIRHWRTRQTERISIDSAGLEGNGDSRGSVVSHDGRFVAFTSAATNLVPGDTNEEWDVFVHDRQLGTTRRVSVDSNGVEGNGPSGFIKSGASLSAAEIAMTPDGQTVAFPSRATNLVPGGGSGVFVHHLPTRTTTRVSVSSQGVPGDRPSRVPAISANGQIVAFASEATNLVPDDTNGSWDVFVHDRSTGQTERISIVTFSGEQGNGDSGFYNGKQKGVSMSADGTQVALFSRAPNLGLAQRFFICLYDRQQGLNRSLHLGGMLVDQPALSQNGGFLAFRQAGGIWGEAIHVWDFKRRALQRIDENVFGEPASSGDCGAPSISADGRRVAFYSYADNLVPDDTFGTDAFLRDRIELSFVGIPQEDSPVHFEARNVLGEAGNLALVLFSFSGTDGIPLPDVREIPLTFDRWTSLGLTFWPYVSTVIDAEGSAATPEIPFPDFPFRYVVSAAAITIDLSTGRIESISNVAEFSMQ